MKTHDLAKALTHLSRILRAGPNVELEELVNLETHVEQRPRRRTKTDERDKGAALALLSEMANYSKPELVELIRSLDIPLEIRPAYSVRDVLGKLLNYINENPTLKQRLATPPTMVSGKTSSLARALSILLGD